MIADISRVRDGLAAERLDFCDDLFRGRLILSAFAGNTAAKVVHHDLCAMLCEVDCVSPAKPATCACHESNLPIKPNCHVIELLVSRMYAAACYGIVS